MFIEIKKEKKKNIKTSFNDFAQMIAYDAYKCYDVIQTDLQCK